MLVDDMQQTLTAIVEVGSLAAGRTFPLAG